MRIAHVRGRHPESNGYDNYCGLLTLVIKHVSRCKAEVRTHTTLPPLSSSLLTIPILSSINVTPYYSTLKQYQ